jgi:phytanoyl-CoA hydroxylase
MVQWQDELPSARAVAHFREEGWLAVPRFFSPRETEALQREVERLRAAGRLRNVATAGDGVTPAADRRNLQLCPMYRDSRLFRALPFHPRVVEAVRALLGDPVLLQLDQVFLKPAGDGAGTAWHQDNAYFRMEDPLRGTAMWIAVHEATAANGTLRLIPRAFHTLLPHYRDPHSDHHIRCDPEETGAVTVALPAGGVVFFCYGTPHATGPNRTGQDRAGVAYHFVNARYAPAELAQPGRDYRPFLTGPAARGGLDEYGERLDGCWAEEVERVLAGGGRA